MHGAAIGPNISAIADDPGLAESDGIWRPSLSGVAANATISDATIGEIAVTEDIDGQTRPETGADIGADEFDGAIGEAVCFPRKASDVGVSFLAAKADGAAAETK